MEATIKISQDDIMREEIKDFLNEGLEDVRSGNLLDFDIVFEELEKRYDANE